MEPAPPPASDQAVDRAGDAGASSSPMATEQAVYRTRLARSHPTCGGAAGPSGFRAAPDPRARFLSGRAPGPIARRSRAKDRIAWRALQAPRPTSTRNAGWSRMAPSTGKHHSVDHVKVVTGLPYRPQDALGKPRERAFIPWVIHRVIQRYVDNMRAFLQKCRSFPDPGQRRGVSCPATALAGCGGLEQQAPHAAAAPRIT